MYKFLKDGTRVFESNIDSADIIQENECIEFSCASEMLVERLADEAEGKTTKYYEKLLITPEAIDTTRFNDGACPLLFNHDWNAQIGVIERAYIKDQKLRVVAKFSTSEKATEILKDIKDGIRKNVSIGYKITSAQWQEQPNDLPILIANRYMIYEVSIVSVPADCSVGITRELPKEKNNEEEDKLKSKKELNDESKIEPEVEGVASELNSESTPENTSKNNDENNDEIKKRNLNYKGIIRMETKNEAAEIIAAGKELGLRDLADSAIERGISLADFKTEALRELSKNSKKTSQTLGLSEKEIRKFSILRAIRAFAMPTNKNKEEAAYELEVSESAKRSFSNASEYSFVVPAEIMSQRAFDITNGSGLVTTTNLSNQFIDVLRSQSVVAQAGATYLNGVRGPLSIPKKTAAATAAWVSLSGALSSTNPTIGQITLSPKKIGNYVDINYSLINQSIPEAEALVMNDLTESIALGIDLAALKGDGSDGSPVGIYNYTNMQSVSGMTSGFTWQGICQMEGKVKASNTIGNLAWVMNSATYAKFKYTSRDTGSGLYLADFDGKVLGHPVYISNQLAVDEAILGDFSSLIISNFGGLGIMVDPYSLSTSNGVRIVAHQETDVQLRYKDAFCVAT